MDLKDALSHIGAQLGELETAARTLTNQNLADVIASARGKLAQAAEHPDIEHAQTALMAAIDAARSVGEAVAHGQAE